METWNIPKTRNTINGNQMYIYIYISPINLAVKCLCLFSKSFIATVWLSDVCSLTPWKPECWPEEEEEEEEWKKKREESGYTGPRHMPARSWSISLGTEEQEKKEIWENQQVSFRMKDYIMSLGPFWASNDPVRGSLFQIFRGLRKKLA